jgi:glutamate/tyrosine decarboxylase-like PLP-dependent enzyme
MENQIVSMTANLLNVDENFAGNVTSGGTESIFLATKVARDMARENKTLIDQPEMIIPVTAHPAFNKAAHYLGVKVITIPVCEYKRADINSINRAITNNTIMLVGSAPNFPHGVIDPIPEMGQIALKNDIYFHVDACMGAFILPFMEMAGYKVPSFDFRVPGVCSISADAHKYAYAPKGTSIILYRNSKLRKHQIFVTTDWPGGIFATTGFLGTRSGAGIASTWALFHLMGKEGYINNVRETIELTKYILKKIESLPGLRIIAKPDMSVISFTSDRDNIYLIGDEMTKRGWYLDRLQFPEGLHMTLTNTNVRKCEEFIKDLTISVNSVRKSILKKVSSSTLLSNCA